MTKKRIQYLLIITLIANSIILVLYIQSPSYRRNLNGFNRSFINSKIERLDEWTLIGNAWRIAGTSGNDIYLNDIKYLNVLAKFNFYKKDTQIIKISIDHADTPHFGDTRLYINDSTFYLIDGNVRRVYLGKIGRWKAQFLRSDRIQFLSAIPLPSGSFLYYMLTHDKGFYLAKKSIGTDSLQNAFDLLQKQQDEIFSKDGKFLFDNYSSKAVYTYSYRNEFIVADTNLHLLYRGHTIDTNSIAKITLSTSDENGTIKMASPPLVVNRKCSVSHGYLFINGALKADNQSKKQFTDSLTIDIYDLKDGKYCTSFLIPNEKKIKLMEFKMEGDKLIALFDQTLKAFKVSIPGINLNR